MDEKSLKNTQDCVDNSDFYDYCPPDEDEMIEQIIEKGRTEFRKEFFQYAEENGFYD